MTELRPEERPAPIDQARYWNDIAGPKWVSLYAAIEHQLADLGEAVIDRAAIPEGARVLDVGSGGGMTTIAIARRVGVRGSVTGLDISLPMVTYALERARDEGIGNASFALADAATARLPEGAFDVLFSRFGVMFFSDPEAAFRNLHRALRPGARLAFICWRPYAENPIMHVPAAAVAEVAPLRPSDPHAPGPFAFADEARTRGFLERAGFLDVAFERLDRTVPVGPPGTLEETAAFTLQMGPAGAAVREAGPAVMPAAIEAVKRALAPYQTAQGVRMPSSTWIVTGRASG